MTKTGKDEEPAPNPKGVFVLNFENRDLQIAWNSRSAHVAQALDAAGALAPRGVRQAVKNCVAAFRKEIPTALSRLERC